MQSGDEIEINPAKQKPTRLQMFQTLLYGLLPYAGGCLVIVTRNMSRLTLVGASICIVSTAGTYLLRRTLNPVYAKSRLLLDPVLYAGEFFFTAVIIRCCFMH